MLKIMLVKVKEGTIVIFPSHLEHSVEKNWSKIRRYSIAFNFYVRGNFGKEEYELQ
jgi:ectoine hydroxylase-related dioxygenase (phytanoyl-CoA dioxygenase family)